MARHVTVRHPILDGPLRDTGGLHRKYIVDWTHHSRCPSDQSIVRMFRKIAMYLV